MVSKQCCLVRGAWVRGRWLQEAHKDKQGQQEELSLSRKEFTSSKTALLQQKRLGIFILVLGD